jgi:predicted GNAT family acetyltransferase
MSITAEQTEREQTNAELVAALRDAGDDPDASAWELDVVNDSEHGRWEAYVNEEVVAELTYRYVGGRVVLLSMWVDHGFRKRRVATELIARVLDEVQAAGDTITVICPVVGEFLARHPGYAGLVDPAHPGTGAFPRPAGAAPGDYDEQLTSFERDLS